ncbi:MAG: dihydropteroate synthase [Acidobacteria bacterium]|nr:dihydropteroate synthase [Acidobacteriota bacterium]
MQIISRPLFTWQLGGERTLALGERTCVMGIVNVTPDSFSDGSAFLSPQRAIDHALHLLDEGADIVDIGAESTKPGTVLALSVEEEQQRLKPVLKGVLQSRPDALISVDTFHAETARFAVEHGAAIVNDVSGFLWDNAMAETLAKLDCGVVAMHTRGRPHEWASQQRLAQDEIVPLVRDGFARILRDADGAGIARERIVLDPGFGFGKRGAENLVLLHHLSTLRDAGRPLLIGLSRKGFLAPEAAANQRKAATIAANTAAILQGAHIVRVHDVREAVQAAKLADALLSQQS